MEIPKYSFGIGDRFGKEGKAQLRSLLAARTHGIDVVPVWNKSNREHQIIGTAPEDVRREADDAVHACGWSQPYYVDADHIGLDTVDRFIGSSDFFTIDVAEYIGRPAQPDIVDDFCRAMAPFKRSIDLPFIKTRIHVHDTLLKSVAEKYLLAVGEAAAVYRHIAEKKGEGNFVAEVSFDEAAEAQTPEELLLILGAAAQAGIRVQTIAPKFAGKFLKGIDYVGDADVFADQFEKDLAVVAFAVNAFGLPGNLKLSVHTGSDKYSLYPRINMLIRKHGAGIHLKTAGTTWLEEAIGLAAAGGDALAAMKRVYALSVDRYEELVKPYTTVVAIDRAKLPRVSDVQQWSAQQFVAALEHDPGNPKCNIHFRQLLHVGYKVAAEMGVGFLQLLDHHRESVESHVADNLLRRHILPLFGK